MSGKVTVECSRCHKKVDGLELELGTSGFYKVAPGLPWAKYANPDETVLCDPCMWADPRYVADYPNTDSAPPE